MRWLRDRYMRPQSVAGNAAIGFVMQRMKICGNLRRDEKLRTKDQAVMAPDDGMGYVCDHGANLETKP